MVSRGMALAALAALALAGAAGIAHAQPWPNRPVTVVVPFGPGASNDTFTRAIATVLSRKFGQPFVIENRPGAGGFTGSQQVQKAAPDGYTFLEMPNSIASFKIAMRADLDPSTDLTTVAVFARSPTAMVVPSALPVKTVQDFIDYARKNDETTFYGYTGIGTTQHLHGSLFNAVTGLNIKGINYKSSAEAQTDLVAGRLQLMFVTVASTHGQIQSGRLRLLGYTANSSPPNAPKAPTMAEAGLKGMEQAQIWWGLFAPNGLSAEILAKMNEGVNEALKDPAVVELFAKSGAIATRTTPEEAARQVKKEVAVYEKIVRKANITFD